MDAIKKFFSKENSVRGATGILAVTLLLSNFLGVIRDHYLAQKIQPEFLDAYFAAFRIPDLLFNLLVLGAIAAAFIPVFTEYLNKETREAWRLVANLVNITLFILLISIILLWVFMPALVPLVVPNFSADKKELTTNLARILLLTPIFFGLSYIFGGILNSFKRFLIYSIVPLVYNLSIIFGTIFFADRFGVYGVVWGVVAGSLLHWLIQFPFVRSLGFKFSFETNFRHPGVIKIGRLMLPRTIGLGAAQLILVFFTALASAWPGSIAYFNLANNIQTMPTVVFGASIATAVFPTLSEMISAGNREKFSHYLIKGIRAIIFLLVPTTVGVILLRVQIVRLVLGSGYFQWGPTITTADTLGFFALSLVASGLIPLLARAFYAFQDTKTPMLISVYSTIVTIFLGYILIKPTQIFGLPQVYGLALAFSIGAFINFFWLYRKLRPHFNSAEEAKVGGLFWNVIFATLIMAIAVQITKMISGSIVDMNRFIGVLIQTLAAIAIGTLGYLLTCRLLGVEEISEILQWIKKRKISFEN